jgi:hypothetical protein
VFLGLLGRTGIVGRDFVGYYCLSDDFKGALERVLYEQPPPPD